MVRLTRLTALVALTMLLAPGGAMAHGGDEPLIHVPLDHVMAGQRFPLIGADLGPSSRVSFRIANGAHTARLGRITAGPDGHFETILALPPGFPDGYAQLTASGSDGSHASAWILVGERPESKPLSSGGTNWWRYAAPILVVLGLGGAGAALAARRRG